MQEYNLIMTVGISGSGKTKFLKEKFPVDLDIRVCPDDIRKEITGDISNMSREGAVWSIAAERTIENLIKHKKSIFDATFCNRKTFLSNINEVRDFIDDNLIIDVYIFKPDVDLGWSRIKEDLQNEIDRSKVPEFILPQQATKLKDWMEKIEQNEELDIRPMLRFHYIDSKTHKEITRKEWYK